MTTNLSIQDSGSNRIPRVPVDLLIRLRLSGPDGHAKPFSAMANSSLAAKVFLLSPIPAPSLGSWGSWESRRPP